MSSNSTVKGVALIIIASVVFCVMGVLIKWASNINTYSIVVARFAVGLAMLGIAGIFGIIKLKFVHGKYLFLRGLSGGLGTFLFFLCISKMGIAKSSVLFYAFPIFASIFSMIFLKERIGILKAAAIVTAFAGMYVLITDSVSGTAFFANFGGYEMLAVVGAILGGISITVIKKLHDTDSSYAMYFAQCVIGFWLFVIPANAATNDIGYIGTFMLLSIGIMGTAGQLLMTQGYKYVPVSTGAPLMMLVPVLSYGIGILMFDELFTLRSLIGSAIVLASCAVVISCNKNNAEIPIAR